MNHFLKLRKKIDAIDTDVINLFQKRAKIVQDVKAYKNSITQKDFTLYIKPKREHDILSRVIQNGDKNDGYSRKFYYHTWRGIISASNFLEQNLSLLASDTETQSALFQHFGMQKVPQIEQNPQKAIQHLQENTHHIYAFSAGNTQFWEELKHQKKDGTPINTSSINVFAEIKSLNDRIFICGKISMEEAFPPALAISTTDGTALNSTAGVFASTNITQNNTLGFFYPLVL